MSDLDEWMKSHINRKRMKFITNLQTELFAQGFPGLHEHLRDKITKYFRHESFVNANGQLLDNIMKIDNYPKLFIWFCRKNDCNPELSCIVKEGIIEYNRLQENRRRRQATVSQAAERSNIEHHTVPVCPDPADVNNDTKKASTFSLNSLVNPEGANVNKTTSNSSERSPNEDATNKAIDFEGTEPQKSCSTSKRNVDYLLKQITKIDICEYQKSERVIESKENVYEANNKEHLTEKVDELERIIEKVNEQENLTSEVTCRDAENKQTTSTILHHEPCPCPNHCKVIAEDEKLKDKTEKPATFNKDNVQNHANVSYKKYINGVTNKNAGLSQNLDSNNIDKKDQIKKTYTETKMAIIDEGNTSNKINITKTKQNNNNNTPFEEKNKNMISNEENCTNFCNETNQTCDIKEKLIDQNQEPEKAKMDVKSTCEEEEEESSGSFYLETSDEEELSSTQNNACGNQINCEIENLKLEKNLLVFSKDSVQGSEIQILGSGEVGTKNYSFPNPISSKFKKSKTTKDSQVELGDIGTSTAGIQCQEDVEKIKCEEVDMPKTISEKQEIGTIIKQGKIFSECIKPSISETISNNKTSGLKMENESNNTGSSINTETTRSFPQKRKSVELCNFPHVSHDKIESIDSISPDTEVKQSEQFIHRQLPADFKLDNPDKNSLSSETEVKQSEQYIHMQLPTERDNSNTPMLKTEVYINLHDANEHSLSVTQNNNSFTQVLGASVDLKDSFLTESCERRLSQNELMCVNEYKVSLDSQNIGHSTSDRENSSDADQQANQYNQFGTEGNLVLVSNQNTSSSTNLLPIQERNELNGTVLENHENANSLNETASNSRPYGFGYAYTFIRNVVHSYFPEFSVRF